MTFDEYNTDENFDKKESSLDELVKIGVSEGKTDKEIKDSLSPKWQKSKKIGEFDTYYKNYATPKKEEVRETEKPAEPFKEETPKTKTTLTSGDKNYMQQVDDVGEATEEKELEKIIKNSDKNYNALYDTMDKQGKAFGKIDDKMVAQFPTFMFKRFKDGEFGDPKSSDAKLRLAYFMINGVQSKLKNASNAAAIAAGRRTAAGRGVAAGTGSGSRPAVGAAGRGRAARGRGRAAADGRGSGAGRSCAGRGGRCCTCRGGRGAGSRGDRAGRSTCGRGCGS